MRFKHKLSILNNMRKAGLSICRSSAQCNIQAYFSLCPYTREQRTIKTIERQRLRVEQIRLRDLQTPLVLQSTICDKHIPDAEHKNVESLTLISSGTSNDVNKSALLDHDNLKTIYNLSGDDFTPPLNICCSGCGANFHGVKPGTHGFLPTDVIKKLKCLESRRVRRSYVPSLPKLCIRCQLLSQYKSSLAVSFTPAKYDDVVLSELNSREKTLIIVVADMLNLPHSIVPLKLANPSSHKFVLIGNKVDQLPIDGPKYHLRWKNALLDAFKEINAICEEGISHVSLVSALNGYGMNQLLDILLSSKFAAYGTPVYIVGSTNVGKSSIFNHLLMSDFCKSEARESIHRATVSFWPCTTVGMLKFPLARMSYAKHALRDQAKYTERYTSGSLAPKQEEYYGYRLVPEQSFGVSAARSNLDVKVEMVRDRFQDLSLMPTYRLRGVDSNGEVRIEDSEVDLPSMLNRELKVPTSIETNLDSGDRVLISGTLDPRSYNPSAWCFDTPGSECPQQTLNFLSSEQWVNYMSITDKKRDVHGPKRRFVLPRTFMVHPGETLLLGRLGRLDLLSAGAFVYLVTHSRLPIHIVKTDLVAQYWQEYADFLGPGCSAVEGTVAGDSMPPMTCVDIDPILATSAAPDVKESIADVVLSGAGWVSVAGGLNPKGDAVDQFILLRAWTPAAAGISLRQPALLPYAVRRRGKRIIYLREYSGAQQDSSYSLFSKP